MNVLEFEPNGSIASQSEPSILQRAKSFSREKITSKATVNDGARWKLERGHLVEQGKEKVRIGKVNPRSTKRRLVNGINEHIRITTLEKSGARSLHSPDGEIRTKTWQTGCIEPKPKARRKRREKSTRQSGKGTQPGVGTRRTCGSEWSVRNGAISPAARNGKQTK